VAAKALQTRPARVEERPDSVQRPHPSSGQAKSDVCLVERTRRLWTSGKKASENACANLQSSLSAGLKDSPGSARTERAAATIAETLPSTLPFPRKEHFGGEKKPAGTYCPGRLCVSRGNWIRTSDLLNPIQ